VAASVEFWFELASTYSYPAACRIDALARAAGLTVAWRPFLLGPIFRAQGWNDSPFNIYPAKGRYMWRDLERVCAKHGLPLRRPTAFPRNGLRAARVATVAADEGWAGAFVPAAYRANFAEDRDVADPAVLRALVASLGRDPDDVLARAESGPVKDALRARTAEAERLGIFGAPTVVVDGELFWGNDRLEDAVAWARRGSA